jgi:hypothetical protein
MRGGGTIILSGIHPFGFMNVAWLRTALPKFLLVAACLTAALGTSWAQAGCGSYLVMRRGSLSSHLSGIQAGNSLSQPVRVDSTLPFRLSPCVGSNCSQSPWETPPCNGPHCQSRSRLPFTPPTGRVVVITGEELIGIPAIGAVSGGTPRPACCDQGLRVPSVTLSGLLRPPQA